MIEDKGMATKQPDVLENVLAVMGQSMTAQNEIMAALAKDNQKEVHKEVRTVEGATAHDAEMEKTKAKLFADMFEKTRDTSEHDVALVKAKLDARLEEKKLDFEQRKEQWKLEREMREERREDDRTERIARREERKEELAEMGPVSRFFSKHGGKVAAVCLAGATIAGPVLITKVQKALED